MNKNADRTLTAVFCDDIRHELGNKMSFMGCYQGELIVPELPAVLAKLCVHAAMSTAQGAPFKALTLRVVQDDDIELARLVVPPEGLEPAAQDMDPALGRTTVRTAIVFSPFSIEKPTAIRLRAITEDGEIVGPRLLIRTAQTEATEDGKAPAAAERKPGVRKPPASARQP